MKHFLFSIFLLSTQLLFSQVILPANRSTNWEDAGLTQAPSISAVTINILSHGADPTGTVPSDAAFASAFSAVNASSGAIILFPEGTYLFHETMKVYAKDKVIIRGDGAGKTKFIFDIGAYSSTWQFDGIHIKGNKSNTAYDLSQDCVIGQHTIFLSDISAFQVGDYLKLFQEDGSSGSGHTTSSWAVNTLAHVAKVVAINTVTNELTLDNPIRFEYQTMWNARVQEIHTTNNCAVECLSVEFINVNPTSSPIANNDPKSIYIQYASESWIKNVESIKAAFGHMVVSTSTNVEITNSSAHDAFCNSCGGGNGYGIVFEVGTNYCLAENNVLTNLRHPILLQSGANANVFGYNRSVCGFCFISDVTFHGNYPFLNLIEGNVGGEFRGDNSGHGQNGPYNTFYRNRATKGITASATNMVDQNYIGNEVSGPLGFAINEATNFVYGNTDGCVVTIPGQDDLDDPSYYRDTPIEGFEFCNWPPIGFPNACQQYAIPAQVRYANGLLTPGCEQTCSQEYQFEVINISSDGATDGSISLVLGSPDLTIYWDELDVFGSNVTELGEGCYTAYIWDADGCIQSETFELGATCCPEDIDGNCLVDINDFLMLNSAFGTTCSGCPEDINDDGVVDINDFIQLNSAIGQPCEEQRPSADCTDFKVSHEDFSKGTNAWDEWKKTSNVYKNTASFECSEGWSVRLRDQGTLTNPYLDLTGAVSAQISFCHKNLYLPSSYSEWDKDDKLMLHGRINNQPWVLIGEIYDDSHGDITWDLHNVPGLDLHKGLLDLRFSLNTSGGNTSNKWSYLDNILIQACIGKESAVAENTEQVRNTSDLSIVHVFPNPVVEYVNILTSSTISDVRIFDMSGKLVHNESSISNPRYLNLFLGHLQPGIYLIDLTFENGSRHSRKLIKE